MSRRANIDAAEIRGKPPLPGVHVWRNSRVQDHLAQRRIVGHVVGGDTPAQPARCRPLSPIRPVPYPRVIQIVCAAGCAAEHDSLAEHCVIGHAGCVAWGRATRGVGCNQLRPPIRPIPRPRVVQISGGAGTSKQNHLAQRCVVGHTEVVTRRRAARTVRWNQLSPCGSIPCPQVVLRGPARVDPTEQQHLVGSRIVDHGCGIATSGAGCRARLSPVGPVPQPCIAQTIAATVVRAAEQDHLAVCPIVDHRRVPARRGAGCGGHRRLRPIRSVPQPRVVARVVVAAE